MNIELQHSCISVCTGIFVLAVHIFKHHTSEGTRTMEKTVSSFYDIIQELRSTELDLPEVSDHIAENAVDIHFAAGFPVVVYGVDGASYQISKKSLSSADMDDLFYRFCDYSVYRHINEINKGYITVFDKYRCGIAGTAVKQRGEIVSVKNVRSMNIRVPRAVNGVSYRIARCKADLLDGLLLVGPPSSGKTTVLRDMIVRLANERCVVVDERRELSWGIKDSAVDFMMDFSKDEAISRAIRGLSPKIIVCDEIADEDILTIKRAAAAGVNFIASVHGDPITWRFRPLVKELILSGVFRRIAVLEGRNNPGSVKELLFTDGFYETDRGCISCSGRSDNELMEASLYAKAH